MIIKTLIATLVLVVGATACLPEEAYIDYNNDGTIDANERRWREWELSEKVKQAHANDHSSTDCYGEMRRHFPASAHSGMTRIITRESGGNAGAKNPSSSARGCYQMLNMHNGRLPAGGSMYNAHDSSIAALSLWNSAGWSPWKLTY